MQCHRQVSMVSDNNNYWNLKKLQWRGVGCSGGQCAMAKPLLENIGGSLVRHTCMYVCSLCKGM